MCHRSSCVCDYSEKKEPIKHTYMYTAQLQQVSGLLFTLLCSPRVEERTIKQSAIVVVSYIIRDLDSSATLLWHVVSLNLHLVFRVPDIKQKHIKVQDGLRGDDVTWGGRTQRVLLILGLHK